MSMLAPNVSALGNLVIIQCTADSELDPISFGADEACDGSTHVNNAWVSAAVNGEHWLIVNFTKKYAIHNVTVFWGADQDQNDFGRIQTWDGFEWTTHSSPIDLRSNTQLYYELDQTVTTDAIRVIAIGGPIASGTVTIREVGANGEPALSASPFPDFLGGAFTWGMIALIGLVAIIGILYFARRRK